MAATLAAASVAVACVDCRPRGVTSRGARETDGAATASLATSGPPPNPAGPASASGSLASPVVPPASADGDRQSPPGAGDALASPVAPPASAKWGRGDAPRGGRSTCALEVGDLVSANVYRGAPRSPRRDDARARLDERRRAEWDAEDHGARYLRCTFAVRMNGRAYTYEHVATGPAPSGRYEPADCSGADVRREVAGRIRDVTNGCRDPHAGAYWGFDLRPAGGP